MKGCYYIIFMIQLSEFRVLYILIYVNILYGFNYRHKEEKNLTKTNYFITIMITNISKKTFQKHIFN